MDSIFVRGLVIEARVGIHDWERKVRQHLVFDLEMRRDISLAAQTDDIRHALDYQDVCESLRLFVESSQYLLIETLAEKSADLLMEKFKIPWLRLQLAKTDVIRSVDQVGVSIERGKKN